MRGKKHYQEFLSSEEGISTNILADRLVRLEEQGLISKSDDPDDKRQFRYSPTQKALDLLPVISEMARWSLKYDPHTEAPGPFLQRLKSYEKGLSRQARSEFKGPHGRDAAQRARSPRRRHA